MEWWEQKPDQVIARGKWRRGIKTDVKTALARIFVIKENRNEKAAEGTGRIGLVGGCLF